jgi:hypothetical protein
MAAVGDELGGEMQVSARWFSGVALGLSRRLRSGSERIEARERQLGKQS